ncbi:hypothetical protein F4861DRAFT_146430 [Xylaria intraflava]|nr:hypothetical protein F4861DRAFT_146430 [Xylaria intraflava]
MNDHVYSLQEVLAVAKIHPFYNQDVAYPPDAGAVQIATEQAGNESAEANLQLQPLLWKSQLYTTVERLVDDTSPENAYRRSIYVSMTGGGISPKPLFFATDAAENRQHRWNFGQFLRKVGIVTPGDWVMTIHTSGKLYRSLDLTSEILENAGASVLCAGHISPANDVIRLLGVYHANVLAGESSQVTQIVHYISTLPAEEREKFHLDKIIYTSEMLTTAQRAYIHQVLGPIKIYSIMASAETGPWAASNPDLLGNSTATDSADFIFDTRAMKIEIFPSSCLEPNPPASSPLPDGEQGVVVATSLSRLRNPVVRYVTCDIGSIHPLPEHARTKLGDAEWEHLRVLRLGGRDRRISFDWDGEYIEFTTLAAILEDRACAVLQWQVILSRIEPSQEALLEIRLLCTPGERDSAAHQHLLDQVGNLLGIGSSNSHRLQVNILASMDGFERSSTGRKVIKFIDRFH